MSLASADERALETALRALNKYGGVATWTDIITPAVKDAFGNIVTPAVLGTYPISVLSTDVKQGWIDNNQANANDSVFMVAPQQLIDLGISFDDKGETITFNTVEFPIKRDNPEMGGQSPVLHYFICGITS